MPITPFQTPQKPRFLSGKRDYLPLLLSIFWRPFPSFVERGFDHRLREFILWGRRLPDNKTAALYFLMDFFLTINVAIDYNIFMNGNELKEWRRNQNLTQGALADLLGVHRVTIAKWEAGDRGIPPFLPLALEALENRIEEETKHGSAG